MRVFVIDAYAWVEYFDGTGLGKKVQDIVEQSDNIIYTNVITLAELASHFKRRDQDFSSAKQSLFSLSSVYSISPEFAEDAGLLHALIKKDRKHMGLADVLVLLTARKLSGKVVTGDEDFRGIKEVVMLK